MNILAVEASTTSAKAMLYHTDTASFEVISKEFSGQKDPAHYDADIFAAQTFALAKSLAGGQNIDMISLSGTWHSLIAADRNCTPVSPAYLWNFTGASGVCQGLREDSSFTEAYYKRTGCMVNAFYPAFKIRWLLDNRPELKEGIFISLGAYMTWLLTGELVSTECLSSGSGLYNISSRKYDKETLDFLGISEDQLSRIVKYDQVFPLSERGADLLGLSSGIPVIPVNSDGGLNQTGVGALKTGVATLSVGTSGAIRITTGSPVIPDTPSTWCYRSPKAYLSGAATNGCNCTDWAKNTLLPAGTGYAEIEAAASDRENTPVFLPFLFGERCPGWNDSRRGGFSNLLPSHTAADMYLAVQEGVLFNLYHCYTYLKDIAGEPSRIRLSGGILNSPSWTQMAADIFGCTMTIDSTMHGSLMGAAVLAMELLGEIDNAADFSPAGACTVSPDPSKRDLYNRKFERYLESYYSEAVR